MTFALLYTHHQSSEETELRRLHLFKNWTPPNGFEFKVHYEFSDGSGGMAVVEASSPAVALEALAPWGPFVQFKLTPAVEVTEAIPAIESAWNWRKSVT